MNTKTLGHFSRRRFGGMLAAAIGILGHQPAQALCSSTKEEGRWRNTDSNGAPAFIDVRMVDCGDQVLNGQQTSTRYRMKVWVRQSSGQFYGRPWVDASYRNWNGKRWLVGKVSTGGYLDHVWMNAAKQPDGKEQMRVLIKHQSLDSKPDGPQSNFWFTR